MYTKINLQKNFKCTSVTLLILLNFSIKNNSLNTENFVNLIVLTKFSEKLHTAHSHPHTASFRDRGGQSGALETDKEPHLKNKHRYKV